MQLNLVRDLQQQLGATSQHSKETVTGSKSNHNVTSDLLRHVERALWSAAARRRALEEGFVGTETEPSVDSDTDVLAKSILGMAPSFSGRWDANKLVTLASTPAFYDIRAPSITGGLITSCAVRSTTNCGASSSFAVAAAAEIAVSKAQGKNCSSHLSPQFLFSCASSWR